GASARAAGTGLVGHAPVRHAGLCGGRTQYLWGTVGCAAATARTRQATGHSDHRHPTSRQEGEIMAVFQRQDIASWSTPWQCRRAGLFGPEGLMLGRMAGQVLRHDGPEHVLVVGTTQSRKTSSFVIPNLLTWAASVLSYDPKQQI